MSMLLIFSMWNGQQSPPSIPIPTTRQTTESVHCVRNTSKSDLLFNFKCSASYNTIPYHILHECVSCGGGQGT